jgi:hypothetical protein
MPATNSIRRALTWTFVAAALMGTSACSATLTASPPRTRVLYDYPVVYVDSVPARVYDSPRVNYRGRPAYLVGSRWYYPTDRGWVYFAEEPRELRQQRTERRYLRAESRSKRRSMDSQREPPPAPPARERRHYSN